MKNAKELKELWIKVCKIYDETIETNSPGSTTNQLVHCLGLNASLEVFAAVIKIKTHDGRISPSNRNFADQIETNPAATVWESNNPFIRAGLDHIHTTHIDQLFSELIKLKIKYKRSVAAQMINSNARGGQCPVCGHFHRYRTKSDRCSFCGQKLIVGDAV